MRPADLAARHPWATAVVAGLVLGGVVGAAWPIRRFAPPAASDQTWTLPDRREIAVADDAAFARVRDASFLGGAVVGREARGQTAVQWRLIAVVLDPAPVAIVQASGAADMTRLRVGDTLPDGARVVGISAGAISFVRDGCPYQRALYVPVDSPDAQGCEPRADTT